ncbi:MAG: ATP-binding protein [Treponema sp.]|nr:ATP-binding protein [Treponema sp.]
MFKNKLKSKILGAALIILFSLVIIMTAYSSFEFYRFTTVQKRENIFATAANLKGYLDRYGRNTLTAAVSVSRFPDVIKAVSDRSTREIIDALNPMVELFDITYFTVTDENGIVLARTYEPLRFGDNVSEIQNITDAMNGLVSTYYESGPVINLSIHTGAPVYDSRNSLIGVISAGIRLDENESVDRLKENFNAEISIFLGNNRIATTIKRDGERIIGSQLDTDLSIHELKEGRDSFYTYNLLGEAYSGFLLPLINSKKEEFAMIVVGISNKELIQERNRLILYCIFIGILGLVIAATILLNIISRIINPVTNLVKLISDVTQGKLDMVVDRPHFPKDEIDLLNADIYLLVDVVKSMLQDLLRLTKELNASGDISFQIDPSRYSGSYKEIIEGINKLCQSISLKNKTMATMDFLETMISVADFDYNILYLNQSLINTYGVDKDNYHKNKCYKVIRNLDAPCSHCNMPELVKNKDSFPSTSYIYSFDECIGKWIGGRSAVIPWIDGSKVLCNYFNDETQVKGFEEQLREAAEKAQAASVAKSIFLASMSHEIRTPMNSIMGFSELALDDIIPERTRDYLSKILENSKGLLQIVNDILDLSKVESGKIEIENIPFDMQELFASCRTLILPKAAEKGVSLFFYAEPSIGKMPLGDPTRLRQVITNLLSNAVKFTNTGTVKVLAEIKERTEETVVMYFEVKDSGIGMTTEQINKVFEPFMQAETGTTRKYGGTGLGLTITRSIVELMGGQLHVDSMPGIGSKFFFTLVFNTIDATNDEMFKQKLVFNEFDKPTFDHEVLLCEDNVMNQQVICEHLARVGIKTVVAWNGRIGLDLVRERKQREEKQFDLIFMDMHMPVMDGLEASAKILEIEADIPIIAMTANIMTDDKEIYKINGLRDCVGKPFTSRELWKSLLKFLTPISMGDLKIKQEDENPLEKDVEFLRSLQLLFVRSNKSKFADIIKALEEGDVAGAHRFSHSLKSNAAQIGKTKLQNAAAAVEKQLKNGKNTATDEQLKTLDAELNIVLNEFAPLLEEKSTGRQNQDEKLDIESVRELFDTLEPLLTTGNPDCLKLIDKINQIPGDSGLINELSQQIEDFDFQLAFNTLEKLKKTVFDK